MSANAYTRQRERHEVGKLLSDFGGTTFASHIQRWFGTHPRGLTRKNTPSVAEWLRRPITLNHLCSGSTHRVTLHPDNTVTFHDHPLTGDWDTEHMLATLTKQKLPTCVAVLAITSGHLDAVTRPEAKVDQSFVRAWRMLLTARAWAHPDAAPVPDKDRHKLIQACITPDQWAPWQAVGYSYGQVEHFLRAGATPAQAIPWLDVHMTGAAAAFAAAHGMTPNLDYTQWAAHDIPDAAARSWHLLVGCQPAEAARLHAHGVNAEAAKKYLIHLTVTDLLDWLDSGFTGKDAASWAAAEVSQANARQWQHEVGITPSQYRQIGSAVARAHIVRTHTPNLLGKLPKPTLRDVLDAAATVHPDTVANWKRAGIPDGMLPDAITSGRDPHQLLLWGGMPAECSDIGPFRTFAQWEAVVDTMTKHRYQQWRTHPVVARWFDSATFRLLDSLVAMQRTGLDPDFLTNLDPTTHKRITRYAYGLGRLAALAPATAIKDMAAAGWLSDAMLDRVVAVAEHHMNRLWREWVKDPTRPVTDVADLI